MSVIETLVIAAVSGAIIGAVVWGVRKFFEPMD